MDVFYETREISSRINGVKLKIGVYEIYGKQIKNSKVYFAYNLERQKTCTVLC